MCIAARYKPVNLIDRRYSLLEKSKLMFPGELSPDGFVELFHRDTSALHRSRQTANHRIDICRFFENVSSGKERPDARFFLSKIDRQAAHTHCVGHDQALKTQLGAQDFRLNFGGQRRRYCRF